LDWFEEFEEPLPLEPSNNKTHITANFPSSNLKTASQNMIEIMKRIEYS
jgi:hypothetical protein